MVIGIYNLEPQYFNLALEKISKYHEDKGDEVKKYEPIFHKTYDTVYASSIFSYTNKSYVSDDMIVGGTGFYRMPELPEEIERIKIFKNKGVTTRGCIRNCPFCIVREKEGNIRVVGDLYDLWNHKSRHITLYDNNILALPDHFVLILEQARTNDLTIDFNQGLDIRLVDYEMAQLISLLPVGRRWRFAWDLMEYEPDFDRGLKHLTKFIAASRLMFYVLVNFNTTLKEDLYRIDKIQSNGCDAFVMLYDNKNADRVHHELARWCNRFIYRNVSFLDYCKMRNCADQYLAYKEKE